MELKYVVTDEDAFAIFSAVQSHREMARAMWGKPVGAGFCTVTSAADSEHAHVHCYGDSLTLNLTARIEDENIINTALRFSAL